MTSRAVKTITERGKLCCNFLLLRMEKCSIVSIDRENFVQIGKLFLFSLPTKIIVGSRWLAGMEPSTYWKQVIQLTDCNVLPPSWYQGVCEIIVKERVSMSDARMYLPVQLSPLHTVPWKFGSSAPRGKVWVEEIIRLTVWQMWWGLSWSQWCVACNEWRSSRVYDIITLPSGRSTWCNY